jgi:hypothetical protein
MLGDPMTNRDTTAMSGKLQRKKEDSKFKYDTVVASQKRVADEYARRRTHCPGDRVDVSSPLHPPTSAAQEDFENRTRLANYHKMQERRRQNKEAEQFTDEAIVQEAMADAEREAREEELYRAEVAKRRATRDLAVDEGRSTEAPEPVQVEVPRPRTTPPRDRPVEIRGVKTTGEFVEDAPGIHSKYEEEGDEAFHPWGPHPYHGYGPGVVPGYAPYGGASGRVGGFPYGGYGYGGGYGAYGPYAHPMHLAHPYAAARLEAAVEPQTEDEGRKKSGGAKKSAPPLPADYGSFGPYNHGPYDPYFATRGYAGGYGYPGYYPGPPLGPPLGGKSQD